MLNKNSSNKLPLALASGLLEQQKQALAEILKKKSIILLASAELGLKPKGKIKN